MLEQNGLSVPTNYEELVTVCAVLAQKGVTPIANALCEWSEIALDCAAMIGAPENQYGQQPSLDGAKSVLTALTKVGAFGRRSVEPDRRGREEHIPRRRRGDAL